MKKIQFALLVFFTLILTGCWETGSGEKIGMITKVAKMGPFCPTWEAEIQRGGFDGGTGVNGAPFHFTIETDAQAKQAQVAMDKKQEVKVFYKTEAVTFCRSDGKSDDHFMTKLEIMSHGQPTSQTVQQVQPTPGYESSELPAFGGRLDRQKIADAIVNQNNEVLRQNQQLIDLLKK